MSPKLTTINPTRSCHAGSFVISGIEAVKRHLDIGTVYDDGARLEDQPLERAVGGGVWFSAAFMRLNLAVAHGIGGSTRVHFSTGVSP